MDADQWEKKWQRKRERFETRMRRFDERRARRRERSHYPGKPLFGGIVFVTIGLILLLGNMGVLEVDRFLRFWPVILIALGVFKLVEYGDDYAHSSGIFWIVVGALFLAGSLGLLRVTAVRDLWPVLLIGFGALMLWRSALYRRMPRNRGDSPSGGNPIGGNKFGGSPFGGSPFSGAAAAQEPGGAATAEQSSGSRTATSSNSIISAMAILGAVERRNNSQDFRGGTLTAILGGCSIDLRPAAIAAGNEPVLEVFALWGGIEIRVPPDWTVVSHVDPILGGYEDSTAPPKEESKRIVIRGTAIMGGIEITN